MKCCICKSIINQEQEYWTKNMLGTCHASCVMYFCKKYGNNTTFIADSEDIKLNTTFIEDSEDIKLKRYYATPFEETFFKRKEILLFLTLLLIGIYLIITI